MQTLFEDGALVRGVPASLGPGYRPSGRSIAGKWDSDKNPKKEIAREWVRFLQDKDFLRVPALEPNAPSFAAFQGCVGKAAP